MNKQQANQCPCGRVTYSDEKEYVCVCGQRLATRKPKTAQQHQQSATDGAALVQENLGIVFDIAEVMAGKLRREAGDLVTSGYIGLTEAAKSFDPLKGASFKTHAEYRVKGAMIDQHRREFGRKYSDGRDNPRMKFNKERERVPLLDFACVQPAVDSQSELNDYIDWATEGLSIGDKLIVNLAVHEEMNQREIGDTMDCSESSISQVLKKRIRPVISQRLKDAG